MSNDGGNGKLVKVPVAGEMATRGFSEDRAALQTETASTALAAQAKAAVESRFIMAMRRPRDVMVSRESLLKDCRRPGFAKVAIYRKPIGKGVEGPSIRLAEAATRALGNIHTETPAVYDDARQRIVRVAVTDLESNVTFERDVTIQKVVERRTLRKGQAALSQRFNSNGEPVFIVVATDDEMLNTENALVSKALRTLLLRLVPGDLLEESLMVCRETMANADAADPDQSRKEMCDAFADLGVTAAMLAEYLGHPADVVRPDEMKTLRPLYSALKDGETSWSEIIDCAKAPSTEPAPVAPAPEKGKANLADVAAASKAKRVTIEMPPEPGSEG